MKSKSILQMKPELVVVAMLVLFMVSGTASAGHTLSPEAIFNYIMDELEIIFWAVVTIMTIVGVTYIAFGSPTHRAAGIRIVSACIIASIAYFVIPYIIGDIKTIAESGNTANTTNTTT